MSTLTISISTFIEVTQAGHGFAAKNVVYRASGSYALAKADAINTSKVAGIVASVIDANTFRLAIPGHTVSGLSGFTDGQIQYLSDSVAGGLTTTIPASPNLAVPVAIATSSTSIIVCNILGHLVFDPLTQDRPDHQGGDLTFHYFAAYDTGEARSERVDGGALKSWLAGEFDALGAAAAAESNANTYADTAVANHVGDPDPHGDRAYADSLVVGLFDDRGNYDASGNVWPSTGGSGTAGAILKGDVWRVSVAGVLGGVDASVDDSFRALTNAPGQTASNWALFNHADEQATETRRGTVFVATQAEAEDSASTNDTDAVTPKKWWQAFASAFGTGVRTALGINVGSAGSVVVNGGALGTPASGNLANCSFPTLNQNTTGSAAQLTTSRNIDGQAFNGTADITVIAPGTHAATGKTTPVDADELPLVDSAASNVLKKLTWANLKATLKTYFDTLYAPFVTLVTESTTSRTLALTDSFKLISCTNSGATAITVPPQSSVTWTGAEEVNVLQKGTGQVTVVPGSGVTLRTSRSLATYNQYSVITIKRLASDEWLVSGDTE